MQTHVNIGHVKLSAVDFHPDLFHFIDKNRDIVLHFVCIRKCIFLI